MGGKNSKGNKIQNLMNDYQIIQQIKPQNITFLEHKHTKEEYLLRQFAFNDQNQCDKVIKRLGQLKNKLAGNKHVVMLKDYLLTSEDQYCSTFHKVFALFEYPQRTLDDEINERALQKRKFTETQLWSILASCILGMSHLQKNRIHHSSLRSSNILLAPDGIVKVSDPFATGQVSNYEKAFTKRQTPHLYLPPQQSIALQQELIHPSFANIKGDIWTMGMIMLQAGLLDYKDECYRDQWSRVHWQSILYNINNFGQIYSKELREMVQLMLSRDDRSRPDWIQLQEYVMNANQEGNKNPKNLQSQNSIAISGKTVQKSQKNILIEELDSSSHTNKHVHFNTTLNRVNSANSINGTNMNTVNLNNANNRANGPNINNVHPPSNNEYQLPLKIQIHSPPVYNHRPIPNHQHTSSKSFQSRLTFGSSQFLSPRQARNPSQLSKTHALQPIKQSFIESTRPLKNMFPTNFYKVRTKPDENLVTVTVEDDDFKNVQTHHTQNYTPPEEQKSYHSLNSKFVVEQYNLGSKYQGFKVNGKRHGQGKFYYQDGGLYEGDWIQNKMTGYGKLYYQSGNIAYEGYWKDDQFSGKGALFNEGYEKLEGTFDYRNFDDLQEYWTKYQGQFFEDSKNGNGVLYLSNGERFEGEFVNDAIHGEGIFIKQNGQRIAGRWNSNHLVR